MALCRRTSNRTVLTVTNALLSNSRVCVSAGLRRISASVFSRPPTSLSQLLRRRLSREQLRWFCDDRQPTCFQVQDADDFRQRVLQSGKPVIVDFYADWCAPCRLLGPRLESIVDTRLGSLLLAKVNVDENADLAMDYDVQSLPTVIAFKDGDIIDKFIGVIEDEDLNSFITKLES